MKTLQTALLFITIAMGTNATYAQNLIGTPQGQNTYLFSLDPALTDTNYSYLYWMGDGGYSMGNRTMTHTFGTSNLIDNNGDIPARLYVKGNYGNNGLPPKDTQVGLSSPIGQLPNILNGETLQTERFREAVPGDTLFFIFTYQPYFENVNFARGSIEITGLDENLWQFDLSANPDIHFPHDNVSPTQGKLKWNYEHALSQGSGMGERRFLIALILHKRISRLGEEEFPCIITHTYDTGIGNDTEQDSMLILLKNSHDPNTIIPNIGQTTDCNANDGIKYNIKFQNDGTGNTSNIQIICEIDRNLNLSNYDHSTFNIQLPAGVSNRPVVEPHIDAAQNLLIFDIKGACLLHENDPNHQSITDRQGEISFQLLPHNGANLQPGFFSRAHIYFDHNPPITTGWAISSCVEKLPAIPTSTYTPPDEAIVFDKGNGDGTIFTPTVLTIAGAIALLLIALLILQSKKRRKS